jgi:hypothetical protein
VLGVSADQGRSWVFANGDVDRTILRQALPELPADLKFPQPLPATITNASTDDAARCISDAAQVDSIAFVNGLKGKGSKDVTHALGKDCQRHSWTFKGKPELQLDLRIGPHTSISVMFVGDRAVSATYRISSWSDE